MATGFHHGNDLKLWHQINTSVAGSNCEIMFLSIR